jgi:Lysylphosphatidylglycerol synthase TM region
MADKDLWLYAAAALLLLAAHVLRSIRWALLFEAEHIQHGRFGLLFGLVLGYAVNAVVPWRVGELIRIWFVAHRQRVRTSFVAATVVAERFADLFVVSVLALLPWATHEANLWPLPVTAVLSLIGIGSFCRSVKKHATTRRWVWRFASIFNNRYRFEIINFVWTVSEFVVDGALLRRRFVLSSIVMWLFYLGSYYAFTIASGQSLTTIVYSMLGSPMMPVIEQAVHGNSGLALSLMLYSAFPIACILAYGASKQVPALFKIINNRRRYGWYANAGRLEATRKKFKAEGAYEYFLISLFGESNRVATNFGLQAIDDGTVHKLFAGGSDAIAAVVEVNNTLLIRKFAMGEAGVKLKEQHDWIDTHRSTFPSLVQLVREKQLAHGYYYDMPLVVPSSDFYDFIHTNPIDKSQAIMATVLEGVHRFHEHHASPGDHREEIDRYIQEKVVRNVQTILEFARSMFDSNTLSINGQTHDLIRWELLTDTEWARRQIRHTGTTRVHGDLTIENIIVDPRSETGWYIIDPNPNNGFNSPLIDWSKQMQSVHLGYEGLNRNPNCQVEGKSIQVAFTRSHAYNALHELLQARALQQYGAAGLREIYFHELVNYLRLTPYKIRQDPRKGICFFACTCILLDRYLDSKLA